MIIEKFTSNQKSNSLFNVNFEDYYEYEEPLPQGPTPKPKSRVNNQKPVSFPDDDYYYYYEDELPQGPTREPPISTGPPRELPLPSGPTRRPDQATTGNPIPRTLSPALSQVLSLPLLTTKKPRKLRIPKKNVQKNVIDEFGPFEGHFIAPPQLNAGALPLATNEDLPLFPPFNNIKRDKEDKDDKN